MDLGVKFSILYDCVVAQSGYFISPTLGRLSPRLKSTRYITKEFTYNALTDFIYKDRLDFCDQWGPLIKEDEDDWAYKYLKDKILSVEKSKNIGEYPYFNTKFDCSWTYDKRGKLTPAIIASNLSEALTVTLHISAQYEEPTRECLYYKDYGQRKGCTQVFTGKINKKFCSNSCASSHQQRRLRESTKEALRKIHEKIEKEGLYYTKSGKKIEP